MASCSSSLTPSAAWSTSTTGGRLLSPELAAEWLDPAKPKERAEQLVLLQGEPAEAFEWFRVSTAVGNVRNQGAQLIDPIQM